MIVSVMKCDVVTTWPYSFGWFEVNRISSESIALPTMGWERELHEAVVTKNLKQVHEILADPEVLKEFTGKHVWKPGVLQCPLHQAAYQGDIGTLKVLLDYGANVNGILDIPSRPPIKMSILHGAVICNEVETVRFLLQRGADVTIQGTYVDHNNMSGEITKLDGSPLSFARAAKAQAIVAILEEHFFKTGMVERDSCLPACQIV